MLPNLKFMALVYLCKSEINYINPKRLSHHLNHHRDFRQESQND